MPTHIPLRRCRVCRTQKPKDQLSRWTQKDGTLRLDSKQIELGRGYYSCSDRCAEILPKTLKKK